VLLDLKLPCFDNVVHNFRYAYNVQGNSCINDVIQYLSTVITYSVVQYSSFMHFLSLFPSYSVYMCVVYGP